MTSTGRLMDAKTLIKFIVWYATKVRGQVSRLRLMKFLYLADWHSVRLTRHRLTHYPWIFYHYGPYSVEAQRDIDLSAHQHLIESKVIEGPEFDEVNLYRCYGDDPEIWRDIGVSLDSFLRREIERWIAKPLPEFLDYVYFETEPMLHARRGDLLNFEAVELYEKPSQYPPPKTKPSRETRARMQEFLERASHARPVGPPPVYDQLYEQAVKLLDEQDSLTEELRGEVDISKDSSLRQSD